MEKYTVIVNNKGTVRWFKFETDKLHRTDGPAIEYANGDKWWYIEGECHRTDGPAVEYVDGYKAWWIKGERHRTDGPAIEYASGDKEWYIENKLHRTDGPAIEWANGAKDWYIEGKRYSTEEDFNKKVHQPNCDGKTVEIDGKKYKLIEVE